MLHKEEFSYNQLYGGRIWKRYGANARELIFVASVSSVLKDPIRSIFIDKKVLIFSVPESFSQKKSIPCLSIFGVLAYFLKDEILSLLKSMGVSKRETPTVFSRAKVSLYELFDLSHNTQIFKNMLEFYSLKFD